MAKTTTKQQLAKSDKIMIGLIVMTLTLALAVVAVAALANKINLN